MDTLSFTFSIWDIIKLLKKHKTSDFKWKKLFKILTCRLLNFGNEFYDDKLISVPKSIIYTDHCYFQVQCTLTNKKYFFIATKKNDNVYLLSTRNSDNTSVQIFYNIQKYENYSIICVKNNHQIGYIVRM